MENSDLESVFQTYLQSYRLHNLETRVFSESSCADGIQWMWMLFGECLLGTTQLVGCLCGALSMLFWAVGYSMTCLQIQPARCLWQLLALTFIVNVVSFAGAIMSFQIIFVIWYDMFTTLVLVLVMSAALLRLTMSLPPCHQHQAPGEDQSQVAPVLSDTSNPRVVSSRLCCMLLCLITMAIFLAVLVSLARINVPSQPLPIRADSTGYTHQAVLGAVGYLLGCVACFGRWWIEVFFVSVFDKEMGDSRMWTVGAVLLAMSNVMYIVTVLFQSGSFRVVMATLPWLVGRTLQGCHQCSKHGLWLLSLIFPLQKHDNETDAKDTSEIGDYSEAINLLKSSDSDSSDNQVIFDRSMEAPESRPVPGHQLSRETTPLQRSAKPLVTPLDVVSLSDSGTTSTTSEQELVWTAHVELPASNDVAESSVWRRQRFSLASRIETLSQSSSETSHQRVRSWISQSTPEEETPPCLTLTLNLDTVNKSTKLADDNLFQNRKCNFAGAFPLTFRKNSF